MLLYPSLVLLYPSLARPSARGACLSLSSIIDPPYDAGATDPFLASISVASPSLHLAGEVARRRNGGGEAKQWQLGRGPPVRRHDGEGGAAARYSPTATRRREGGRRRRWSRRAVAPLVLEGGGAV